MGLIFKHFFIIQRWNSFCTNQFYLQGGPKKWTNFQMTIHRVLLKLEWWRNYQMKAHYILFQMVYSFMLMQATKMVETALQKNLPSRDIPADSETISCSSKIRKLKICTLNTKMKNEYFVESSTVKLYFVTSAEIIYPTPESGYGMTTECRDCHQNLCLGSRTIFLCRGSQWWVLVFSNLHSSFLFSTMHMLTRERKAGIRHMRIYSQPFGASSSSIFFIFFGIWSPDTDHHPGDVGMSLPEGAQAPKKEMMWTGLKIVREWSEYYCMEKRCLRFACRGHP